MQTNFFEFIPHIPTSLINKLTLNILAKLFIDNTIICKLNIEN